jgi:hypothetical protein
MVSVRDETPGWTARSTQRRAITYFLVAVVQRLVEHLRASIVTSAGLLLAWKGSRVKTFLSELRRDCPKLARAS